jgi:AraC-like DNA-binding protein
VGFIRPKSFGAIPSATGGIARLACARLREAGKNVEDVLSTAGLTVQKADDPVERLEVRAEIKFLELAAQELKDELFGFHLARSFDLREIGLVYYVMASSEQLADALRNCERYSTINNEGVRLHVDLAEGATIALEYVDADRWSDRHHMEFWLVTLVRICRQVTDSRLASRRLKVRHFRTNPPADLRNFFGTDVEFGADADEISFSTRIASLPTVGRDLYLNRLLRRYAEEALARHPPECTSFRAKVEKAASQLLPHGKATISEAARRLGMSSRTMSRRLRDENVTFAEILDELRAALAKRYLSDRELPVSEIAWLLGYREVSSLTHAFRRWTGMTPRRFRSSDRRGERGNSLSVLKRAKVGSG